MRLRRKMRRVGVQLQDIGSRLCWQAFVDNPGEELGVAKLVHIAEPADLAQLGAPDLLPYPPDVKQPMQVMLPFQRFSGDNDTGNTYVEDGPLSETGTSIWVTGMIKSNLIIAASPPLRLLVTSWQSSS